MPARRDLWIYAILLSAVLSAFGYMVHDHLRSMEGEGVQAAPAAAAVSPDWQRAVDAGDQALLRTLCQQAIGVERLARQPPLVALAFATDAVDLYVPETPGSARVRHFRCNHAGMVERTLDHPLAGIRALPAEAVPYDPGQWQSALLRWQPQPGWRSIELLHDPSTGQVLSRRTDLMPDGRLAVVLDPPDAPPFPSLTSSRLATAEAATGR
jgi:hypothetical protein